MSKVVILGLGKTGLSCVNYFLRQGITPIVLDTRANPPGRQELASGVELRCGALDAELLCQAELIIASPGIALATPALQAAAAQARAAGLAAHVLSDAIEGESREVGRVHAALARAVAERSSPFEPPCVLLSGGETTVTIGPGARGRGGRATEFCMGLAQGLQAHPRIWALAADTDGIDGVEDNAGARVSPCTLKRAAEQNLRISDHLDRNDAYGYFSALGDLVITGPTHTNVNDFRAILIL